MSTVPVTGPGRAPSRVGEQPASQARERILAAAYDLFSRQGVRAVGIDAIIEQAGVARMTFYRHFPSKDQLVIAFLKRREELWTYRWLETEVRKRAVTSEDRLLAIFDVFHEWFQRSDFEGCSFINILLETFEQGHPVREATTFHLANIRAFLRGLGQDAGVEDPDDFSRKWHILMKGSIVAAAEGDTSAARRAREVGAMLLAAEVQRDRRSSGHTTT